MTLAGCFGGAPPPEPGQALLPIIRCAAPCELTIDAGEARAFEPAVAANPRDPRHLVVAINDFTGPNYSDRWIFALVTRDAGASWTKVRIPGGRQDPQAPLAACAWLFDPLVSILDDGTVLVGGVAAGNPYPGPFAGGSYRLSLFVARSTDGGMTFPDVSLPGESSPACAPTSPDRCMPPLECAFAAVFHPSDKPFIASRGAMAYVSWLTRGGIRFAQSADGGRTWKELPGLSPSPDLNPYSAALAVASNGTLLTAFTHASGSDSTFTVKGAYFGVLRDDGWETRLVDPTGAAYPAIATMRRGKGQDQVFLGYPVAANDNAQTPSVRWSQDGGAHWSDALSLDVPEAAGWIVPTLTVDAEGRPWSGFYHQLANGSNEYRVASLENASALGPFRVDRSRIGQQALGLQLGHYMGIAGLPHGAFMVWVSGSAPGTDLRGAGVFAEPTPP